jgi:hypothetical protein
MDFQDQPVDRKRLDVAAHRHVGDAQEVDQLRDARPADAFDLARMASCRCCASTPFPLSIGSVRGQFFHDCRANAPHDHLTE